MANAVVALRENHGHVIVCISTMWRDRKASITVELDLI